MTESRYTVKVRPSRLGFTSSVSKETKVTTPLDLNDRWIGWSPEPTYWRLTESWAIRRAARKRRRLMAKDRRVSQTREVHRGVAY